MPLPRTAAPPSSRGIPRGHRARTEPLMAGASTRKGSCQAASTPSPNMPHLPPSWFTQLVLSAHAAIHKSCGLIICREYGKVLEMGSTCLQRGPICHWRSRQPHCGPRLSQSEPSRGSSRTTTFKAPPLSSLAHRVSLRILAPQLVHLRLRTNQHRELIMPHDTDAFSFANLAETWSTQEVGITNSVVFSLFFVLVSLSSLSSAVRGWTHPRPGP